jgi:hypothetical protein
MARIHPRRLRRWGYPVMFQSLENRSLKSSNRWKFFAVLFPIIGTCAMAQGPGSLTGFFQAWWGKSVAPAWTPADMPNIISWWTVTDESTLSIVAGTNRVSEWRDKIGTNNFAQTGVNARPFYTDDDITSQKVISFPTTSENLSLGYDLNGSNKLFYIVYRKPTTVNTVILIETGGSSEYLYLQYGNTFFVGNGTQTVGIETNAFMLRGAYSGTSGTSVVRYSNGVAQAATTFNSNVRWGRMGAAIQAGNFRVRELVFVNGNPVEADRQKLEGYLAWNNDIVDKLPADHPYKNAPP